MEITDETIERLMKVLSEASVDYPYKDKTRPRILIKEADLRAALSSLPHPQEDTAKTTGALTCDNVKQFARWHHLNEMTIAAKKTPSDSEIDCEVMAWRKIESALAAQTTDAVPVAIKPLEWGDYPNPHFAGPDVTVANFDTFGSMKYQAQRDPWALSYVTFLAPQHGTLFWESKGHQTIEEAKLAAQADYERRIRSALEPSP